jgi:hypothetical protein
MKPLSGVDAGFLHLETLTLEAAKPGGRPA